MRLDLNSYIGKKYGRLRIVQIGEHKKANNGKRIVFMHCLCDCGNNTHTRLAGLKNNSTKSCGCITIERSKTLSTKHGLSRHPLYSILCAVKSRCYSLSNKCFKLYGGRGIKICEEWQEEPSVFIEWGMKNGWEKGLQIDRIDVNGDYSPSNCRFVSPLINARNKRFNLSYEYKGEIKTLKEWCDDFNIKYITVYTRMEKLGWDFKKSIETPSLPLFGNKTVHGTQKHRKKIERQRAGLEPR